MAKDASTFVAPAQIDLFGKIARTKLAASEQFKLYEFVRDNYVNLKQTDEEFAETAYKAMDPKPHVMITRHHVHTARGVFGIPATKTASLKTKVPSSTKAGRNYREMAAIVDAMAQRIEMLEQRMARWEE